MIAELIFPTGHPNLLIVRYPASVYQQLPGTLNAHRSAFNYVTIENLRQHNYVFNVRCARYHAVNRFYPTLIYVATSRSDAALPLTGGRAFAEYAFAEYWNECDCPLL